MTFILTILAVAFLVGVLIGSALTERALESRTRRQAAMQRSLNSQLQELEAAWQEIAVNDDRESDLSRIS
ncbi:MAG: hypothetical protein JO272_08515 [Pseudonocardiales bacterium]|jgi:uncharacterized membrane-anchored protein YhcB (DUF1043 family)|nr:hypothetical protein [Pseudonocardiales bacterium]